MTRRFVIGLGLVFSFIVIFSITSSRSTDATTFEPRTGATTLSTNARGANPDITVGFSFLEPSAIFASGVGFTDRSFTIAPGSAITNGKVVGQTDTHPQLSALNSTGCGFISETIRFTFRDADTSTSDLIAPIGPVAGAGKLANLAEDHRGDVPPEAIYQDTGATAGQVDPTDTYLLPGVAAGQTAPDTTTLVTFPSDVKYVDYNGNSRYDESEGVAGGIGVSGMEAIYLDTGTTANQVDATDTLLLGSDKFVANGNTLTPFDTDERFVDSVSNSVYDGSAPNGLPDYLDATPTFNNILFTPTDSSAPLEPHARYVGNAVIATLQVILQVVIFDKNKTGQPTVGVLTDLPNGEQADASLGWPSLTLLQDSTSAPSKTIVEFCTAVFAEITLCGKTDSDETNNTPLVTCDVDENSETRLTSPSPSVARTVQNTFQTTSARDTDNDGHEDSLDTCRLIDTGFWDPRAISDSSNFDDDADALPNVCDNFHNDCNSDAACPNFTVAGGKRALW